MPEPSECRLSPTFSPGGLCFPVAGNALPDVHALVCVSTLASSELRGWVRDGLWDGATMTTLSWCFWTSVQPLRPGVSVQRPKRKHYPRLWSSPGKEGPRRVRSPHFRCCLSVWARTGSLAVSGGWKAGQVTLEWLEAACHHALGHAPRRAAQKGRGAVTEGGHRAESGVRVRVVGNILGRVRVRERFSTLTPSYSLCLFLSLIQTNCNVVSFPSC